MKLKLCTCAAIRVPSSSKVLLKSFLYCLKLTLLKWTNTSVDLSLNDLRLCILFKLFYSPYPLSTESGVKEVCPGVFTSK